MRFRLRWRGWRSRRAFTAGGPGGGEGWLGVADGDDPDVEAVGGIASGEDVECGVVDVDEAVVAGDADAEAVGGAGVDVVGLVADGEVDGEALRVLNRLGGDELGGGVLVGDVAQGHG